MPRPRKNRRIYCRLNANYFKPRGIPMSSLEEVILEIDEFEALRLKDKIGLEQTEAAERMKISQSTFQRILTSARKKIAEAITEGRAIKIEKK